MTDPRTIATYDRNAEEYARRFSDPEPGAQLRAFMDLLPAGGHVLDLGCGHGITCARLLAAGFQATGTDASAAMIEIASRIEGGRFRQATFDELDEVAVYDGVWANFSLLHAPRAAFPGHLAAIHRALKPGGILHIGLKTGTGAARDALDRMYTFYEPEELRGHIEAAGFLILGEERGREAGLAGTIDPWIVLRAQKA